MRFQAALLGFAAIAFSQSAPPVVDQALRARVNEFFGYHVTGEFRKAYDLVADDTKDYYFAVQKNTFISFKIVDVKYSDDWTRATVRVDGTRKIRIRPEFPETTIVQPMPTTWKIENGKWVWYVDKSTILPTPMSNGPHPTPAPSQPDADGSPKLPDLSDKGLQNMAQEILKQSNVNKPNVVLEWSRECSETITFHNGQQGYVKAFIDPGTTIEGFSAKIDKENVAANQDATVTVHWTPGKAQPPQALVVKVIVQPTDQVFPIVVSFVK